MNWSVLLSPTDKSLALVILVRIPLFTVEAWSWSFQVLILAPVFQTCLSPQDGPAYHLPQEVVLQHKEQQKEGGQDPWWQAGFSGKVSDLFFQSH